MLALLLMLTSYRRMGRFPADDAVQPAEEARQGPTWSHFKNLTRRLEWLDGLGDTDVWMDGVAAGKITDFTGEADAAARPGTVPTNRHRWPHHDRGRSWV
ncbi:hypothetical protein ACWD5R_26840 [Streptomyces sp. NPDC002514]|uniref:hypothetical protein n=1 Tax=Streptomyces sp. NPDC001270 TaxID=3364554 RepID=UPI00368AA564